jgi:hypothetical protein
VVDQLALLFVHLGLQAAEPSIEIMLTERMWYLFIILQSVLQVLFCLCILAFIQFHISSGSLAAGRAKSTTELGEFSMSNLKEGFGVGVCALRKKDAGFNSEKIGNYQILTSLQSDQKAIIEIALYCCALHLADDEDNCQVVDYKKVNGLFLLYIFFELKASLLFGLHKR